MPHQPCKKKDSQTAVPQTRPDEQPHLMILSFALWQIVVALIATLAVRFWMGDMFQSQHWKTPFLLTPKSSLFYLKKITK